MPSTRYPFAPNRHCTVCDDALPTRYQGLSCGHPICRSCVVQSQRLECPLCRSSILVTRREQREHNDVNNQRRQLEHTNPSTFDDGLGPSDAPRVLYWDGAAIDLINWMSMFGPQGRLFDRNPFDSESSDDDEWSNPAESNQ